MTTQRVTTSLETGRISFWRRILAVQHSSKDVLELELEQWRESMEKKVARAKTEYMCLNETPLGSVEMKPAQLPQVTEFKYYMGSTMQSDADMNTIMLYDITLLMLCCMILHYVV